MVVVVVMLQPLWLTQCMLCDTAPGVLARIRVPQLCAHSLCVGRAGRVGAVCHNRSADAGDGRWSRGRKLEDKFLRLGARRASLGSRSACAVPKHQQVCVCVWCVCGVCVVCVPCQWRHHGCVCRGSPKYWPIVGVLKLVAVFVTTLTFSDDVVAALLVRRHACASRWVRRPPDGSVCGHRLWWCSSSSHSLHGCLRTTVLAATASSSRWTRAVCGWYYLRPL